MADILFYIVYGVSQSLAFISLNFHTEHQLYIYHGNTTNNNMLYSTYINTILVWIFVNENIIKIDINWYRKKIL